MSRRDGKKSQSQTTLGEEERASLIEDICNNVRKDFADAIDTIVGPRLDRIEEKLNELSTLRATVSELEKCSWTYKCTNGRWSAQRYLPWLPMSRGWLPPSRYVCLTWMSTAGSGPWKGQAGEEEDITRQSCVKLARDQLGVNDALPTDFAACHRLRQQYDASILVRFVDLNKRNQWLSSAKNLKGKDTNISISPDLPPVLRPLKRELLNKRKTLPPQQKSRAHLRYLREWPYIELSMGKNVTPIRPEISKRSVVQDTIGFSPLLSHWTIWTIVIYNYITEFAFSVS